MSEEYISRQAAQKVADDCSDEHRYAKDSRWPETYSPYHEGWTDACDTIFARLESVPTADVRPVVRGRWIPFTSEAAGDIWYCSSCGVGFAHHMDFCPHCGADMRGGDADGDEKD